MFSAVNVLFMKLSGRNTDSNATLSKSIATYGRPLANGLFLMVHTQFYCELSYFEIYEL